MAAVELDSQRVDEGSLSASEDGIDTDVQGAADQRPVAGRKRVDYDHFKEWLRGEGHDSGASSDHIRYKVDEVRDEGSRRHDPATRRIITSPREYQIELFERAKEKNIIAVLNTGSGKTLIAALLLRHVIEQELDDRARGLQHRIAFFLVDKVSLVLQQYKVLKANLDHNVERFCGDLVDSHATADFWKTQFDKNKVIVCTAAILQACLHRGWLRIDQINLLIFDEAHHAKKNHPYARIMKDFYARLEREDRRRPRVFGMTASPVDTKGDIDTATAQLEGTLCCTIATAADPIFMTSKGDADTNPDIFDEEFLYHGQLPAPFETAAWKKLDQLVGQLPAFRKILAFSRSCTRDLGRWCADTSWKMSMTAEEVIKLKARAERDLMKVSKLESITVIDQLKNAIDTAHKYVQELTIPEPDRGPWSMSQKVLGLVQALEDYLKPDCGKCIIFVQERLTAVLLMELLKRPSLGLGHVRPGALLGSSQGGAAGDNMDLTFRQQQAALDNFRVGKLNCLVSTSVAEEGLDIPDCNLVIRFDLCDTTIQYIQSRGRARTSDSRYFHMVEHGNEDQTRKVRQSQENAAKLQDFCAMLPEDRQLTGNDFDLDYFLAKEKCIDTYINQSTGATLTYKFSLQVISAYVASLPHPPGLLLEAQYSMKKLGNEYQSELILPNQSRIIRSLGQRSSSKQAAKCSAAYNLCIRLREGNLLNGNWVSTLTTDTTPLMTNRRLALSSKSKNEYPMILKPGFWSLLGLPTALFITVLKLTDPESMGRSSRPLAILTRAPVPKGIRIPIFFEKRQGSVVEVLPLDKALLVTPEESDCLTHFTLRIFRDVFSKEFKSETEKLPYYIAPLTLDHGASFAADVEVRACIDWACLELVQNTDSIDCEGDPEEAFKCSRYVTDPHDGSRKFWRIRRREDLRPTDEQLPLAPKKSAQGRGRGVEGDGDIWNYSISLWAKSRAARKVRHELAVVEAQYIPLRRNLLDPHGELEEKSDIRCYLVFETLKLSALPVDVVAMAYTLPAIMHRLDDNLIVLEACEKIGLDIPPSLALEAMTKDSDDSHEENGELANFQRGMGNNYERLEFLGDCFLKMSTTIALFTSSPDHDEHHYHVDRMTLICNKNLFATGLRLKLEQSVRSKQFNRRLWYPIGLELLRGKQNVKSMEKHSTHCLADKGVADVCEALIGAAYLTTYKKSFDLAVRAVSIFVHSDKHSMSTFGDFYRGYNVPKWQLVEPTEEHKRKARVVAEVTGYSFRYPRLLRSAFIHPSYAYQFENIPNYQQLEFLGDALLDMVCVDFLFHRHPHADPQWLTEHKMAMVSNKFLGCLGASLGFHQHMQHWNSSLIQQIAAYISAIGEAKEEAAKKQAQDRANYWVDAADPPKCLPDTVEAFVGAMFVDSQYDYSTVQRFFDRFIKPFFEDMHLYDTFANKHPVTFLANVLQLHFKCADWRLLVEEMPVPGEAHGGEVQVVCGVMIHGRVVGSATAASGRYAKTAAAKKVKGEIEGLAMDEFKAKFHCCCRPEDVDQVDTSQLATAI